MPEFHDVSDVDADVFLQNLAPPLSSTHIQPTHSISQKRLSDEFRKETIIKARRKQQHTVALLFSVDAPPKKKRPDDDFGNRTAGRSFALNMTSAGALEELEASRTLVTYM